MRILRVAQKVYPDVKGGGPYHVHAMSRDQAEMGHDVTVLTVSEDNSKPRREEREGYTLVRRKPTIELLGNGISGGVAKFLVGADEYDVVHAHSHLYFSTNLAALKRRFNDTPLAITNHGLYSQNAPKWMFDAYLRTVGRWTFDSADVLFCYTGEDEKRIREFGVSTDVEVVSNGVDQARFTPHGPESELIDAEGPVVLFVGRFVEGKQPSDAIEAFVSVRKEYPDAELYLCGEGPLRTELEQLVEEHGLSGSVTFLGHVAYDEMPRIYRSATLLVLPSRAEGLPRTVLEAFATKIPAVVTNLDHISDIVNLGGTTVPERNISEFSGAIIELIEDDSRRSQLGASGRELIQNQFNWDRTVKETTYSLEKQTKLSH